MKSSRYNLSVTGMTCASCVGRVERSLQKVDGVESVEVNLLSERASVSGLVDAQQLLAAVHGLGFGAEVIEDFQQAREQQRRHQAIAQRRLGKRCFAAIALTLPIFVMEMGKHLIPGMEPFLSALIPHHLQLLISAILASCVQFGPGLSFYRKGVPSLLRGHPEMNSMVMLGTSAAWSYSMLVCLFPQFVPDLAQQVYFEASAVIISLVLLGRWLEGRAKGRSGAAIRKLLDLQVAEVRVWRNEEEQMVALDQLNLGDQVRLRAGEQVPVDATIVHGSCYINESMLTGESMPQSKGVGDQVVAGTLMTDGYVTLSVSALGANTVLSQMISMVEEAQSAKLPIQALIDRVTAVFVPIVLFIAVLTVMIWLLIGPSPALNYALVTGISVLIIACPCAMGLATPLSILVTIGRSAEHGLLFRRGDALQALNTVDVVAFDKTGTLTHGRPEVLALRLTSASQLTDDGVLSLAASVEQASLHPIALALMAAAKANKVSLMRPDKVQVFPGFGISGVIQGDTITIGSIECMRRYAHVEDQDIQSFFSEIDQPKHHSHVFIARNDMLIAYATIADALRPESFEAVQALRNQGKTIQIISGDHPLTVTAVAEQLGIEHFDAAQLPQDKIEAIKVLQKAGRKVAFVGDGMNDAAALVQADVGIAVGSGTDIAVESADIVLSTNDLRRIPLAFDLSRHCMRNIRQNLFWAFAYNSALIPIAAGLLYPFGGGFLSPMLAALAMALSSLCVVGNALRLRRM